MDEELKKEQKESDAASELAPEELDQVAGGHEWDWDYNGNVIQKPKPLQGH